MSRPFKLVHKSSGYFYRPCTHAVSENTGKYVKTNLSKTGGKIYTRDPRKHINYIESHITSVVSGKIDPFQELEIYYL